MMLLWACVLWVLASAAVALLPMRHQYVAGVLLLLAAPCLILWLAVSVHWAVSLFAGFAFLSMYRNPLRYFWARARGLKPEMPT
ncbi:MAG: DUF2484 family protein [Roseobacter sp.]|jgi:hypothetical protein|nr:DUF2484 family protein [Roseobacter sp.]